MNRPDEFMVIFGRTHCKCDKTMLFNIANVLRVVMNNPQKISSDKPTIYPVILILHVFGPLLKRLPSL